MRMSLIVLSLRYSKLTHRIHLCHLFLSLSKKTCCPAGHLKTFIAAILLTAGLSTRASPRNKLLVAIPGDDPARPMVRRSAEILLNSRAQSVIVVTGHEADQC